MENFTAGDDNYSVNFTIKSTAAAAGTASFAGFFVFLAGLNIVLSITASLGNVLILIALHKVTSIYPPTKLLFRCLAVTDLCVGLISQPLFSITLIPWTTNRNIFYYSNRVSASSAFILCGVSTLTSSAIAVDRLLALLLGLRYRQVVTLRRVQAVIVLFWLLSCALGGYSTSDFKAARDTFIISTLLPLLISVFSYLKIYLRLRHNQLQVQDHFQQPAQPPNGGTVPLNVARYKKTVSTIAWVQFALLACYLPNIVVGILFTYGKLPDDFGFAIFRVTISIFCFNSSLNPILYCWKIREVKQAAKDTIRQLSCCISN